MIEELPIPQAWEWIAVKELSSIVHGLAAQGFDTPGDLVDRLNSVSEAIAQLYQGADAVIYPMPEPVVDVLYTVRSKARPRKQLSIEGLEEK